ncbi:hypothetical protein MXAZACID_11529 [Acidocella sp. MX-AZ02]|nr:hypothetical protein MXAZACID_11529 [Acidocella sp. MX-AZ02]
MVSRMPILGEHNVVEIPRQAVDQRRYFIAAGYGKRAAGAEIILQVDNQKGRFFLHGLYYRENASGC